MTGIPVVVVDDDVADRYIVRRRLAKAGGFGEVFEATNGNDFIERHLNGDFHVDDEHMPVLVLMDVNMPRLTGFETIMKMNRAAEAGNSPPSLVMMMVTSSSDPKDMVQITRMPSIKGYVFKPLDDAGVHKIRMLYA